MIRNKILFYELMLEYNNIKYFPSCRNNIMGLSPYIYIRKVKRNYT